MSTLSPGDKVSGGGQGTPFAPYTGTVTQVWVGFVRVDFDKPQGEHRFTLTSPRNLTLLPSGTPSVTFEPVPGSFEPRLEAVEFKEYVAAVTETPITPLPLAIPIPEPATAESEAADSGDPETT